MKLDWDKAVQVANQAVFLNINRSLTDIEVIVLKGAWQRQEYDEIAIIGKMESMMKEGGLSS